MYKKVKLFTGSSPMGIQTISKQVGFNQHADYEFSSALKIDGGKCLGN